MHEYVKSWMGAIGFVTAVILSLSCYSQSKTNDILYTSDLDSIEYNLVAESLAPSSIQLPFRGITILDARFDTSKLGFEKHQQFINLNKKDFRKIKLKGGIKNNILGFYNDYYQRCFSNSTDQLLMVFKTLWIDNLPDRSFRKERITDIVKESYQDIYIKVEFYLKRISDYYPLKRVDTVFQLTEQNIHSPLLKLKKNNLSFFLFALKSLLENYDFNMLTENNDHKKMISIKEIDSFNNKRFLLPVLNVKKITNGVYMHFREFANNDPSIGENDYYINKKGKVMIKNDLTNEHFYWAIADDSGIHIREPLLVDFKRIGNTFEFFLNTFAFMPKSLTGNFLDLNENKGKKIRFFLTPRQIDMETGIIY